ALLVASACQPGRPLPTGPDIGRMQVFVGLGAWWDVYDWSPTFTNGPNPLKLHDVDRLAANGVQTLYIQPATFRHPALVLDPGLLRSIVDRAHAHGMRVVGWYLPRFYDMKDDLDRMVAM